MRVETVMTYADWQREYSIRRKRNLKRVVKYYLKGIPQKLVGILLILSALKLRPVYANEDGTVLIALCIIGILCIVTRNIFRIKRK